jgi:ubiquinone/menaquinone biosynthesis C-methylase UbiE
MRTSRRNEFVQEQQALNRYFTKEALYWEEIYQGQGVKEVIHQRRLQLTLEMIDSICPPVGSRTLDVGCGAGMVATALAEKNYIVDAIDPVQVMVDLTRARATRHGVESRVLSNVGDVCSLPFADDTFAIVVALGVLPWLPSIKEPLKEMRRVLKSDGHMIVTVDNTWALRWFFDPLTNPILRPTAELTKSIFRRFGCEVPPTGWHPRSRARFDKAMKAAGIEKVSSETLGFGPFTCFNRELLPQQVGLKVHGAMQYLADRPVPVFRGLGSHYLVMAKKRAELSSE